MIECRKRVVKTYLADVRLDVYTAVVVTLCLIVAVVTR